MNIRSLELPSHPCLPKLLILDDSICIRLANIVFENLEEGGELVVRKIGLLLLSEFHRGVFTEHNLIDGRLDLMLNAGAEGLSKVAEAFTDGVEGDGASHTAPLRR